MIPNISDILDGCGIVDDSSVLDINLQYVLAAAICFKLKDKYVNTGSDPSSEKFAQASVNALEFMDKYFFTEIQIMMVKNLTDVLNLPIADSTQVQKLARSILV